jgi:hypothetical protein
MSDELETCDWERREEEDRRQVETFRRTAKPTLLRSTMAYIGKAAHMVASWQGGA